MSKQNIKPIALAISAAFATSLAAGIASADTSPFSATHLTSGYMADAGDQDKKAAEDTEKKGEEGKCGEGKCGEKKGEEGKCGEGKCGEKKGEEGKCGEGKCGEGKCGEKKGEEGKGEEGKCGGHE